MQLCKFFKLMSILTILAVTYIHLQMQIIDLAYAGNQKEQRIQKLIEQNGSTTYKILMLKSANHLGDTILESGSPMQFADSDDVVRIETSQELFTQERPMEQSKLAKRAANTFMNLLSLGHEAEAKPAE